MSEARIVLVGSAVDDHVLALLEALRARGRDPVVFDSLACPERTRLALGSGIESTRIDDLPLGRPQAVYLRSLYLSPVAYGVDVDREMDEDWRKTLVIFREKAELLVSVLRRWEELGVPIYNPLTASDAIRKPYQLARLARAGLPVPETLWTNDPAAVREFARGRRVAYKPVAGGAATRELGPADLTDERLARLAHAPVTFQELLPGEDLRVYVLDGRIAAAYRIDSDSLDFRGHEQRVQAIPIEPALERTCLAATEVCGLRFTGMDLKRDADGTLRLLELNPSPMFLGFDRLAGTDLLGQLAAALAGHAG